MQFFSEITRIFQCDIPYISERLDTVEATFSINFLTLPSIESINSVCSLVPARDSLLLTLKNDSDNIVTITNRQTQEPNFSELTDDLTQDDNIYINIRIDKTTAGDRFSIYDFSSFAEDLLKRSLVDVMRWFSGKLRVQEYLLFQVFDYDISISTRTMAFESSNTATFRSKIDRSQRLSACKDTAYFYNMNFFEIIPDDFIIEGVVRSGDCLKSLFGKIATILSLIYVSSSSSINDDTVSIQISGQRTTSYELKLDSIREDEKWICIYSWIFTDGNPTDKSLIAHNVISLHCKYEALLSLDSAIFDAIKTNYNLYLRNNVNQYLDMKRDISRFIQNIVSQVGDYAVAILGKFKGNLLAIFGFLFTVVLTRVGGTQKWDDIFTKDTIYLIEIFVGGSLVYLLICLFETRYKLKKTKQSYFELKENYKEILSNAEIKHAFMDDNLLRNTERSIRRGIIVWTSIWGGLLLLTIVFIEVFTTNHGLIIWLWQKMRSL